MSQLSKDTESKHFCSFIYKAMQTLDSNRWKDPTYPHKKVSTHLKDTLQQCGIIIKIDGNTYHQDHVQQNGTVAESAL